MSSVSEEIVELSALEWLAEVGYRTRFGRDIALGEPTAERSGYDEALILGRLRVDLERINSHISTSARPAAIDEAIRKLTHYNTFCPCLMSGQLRVPNHKENGAILL